MASNRSGVWLLCALGCATLGAAGALGLVFAQETWVRQPAGSEIVIHAGYGGPPFDPSSGPLPPSDHRDAAEANATQYGFVWVAVPAKPGDLVRFENLFPFDLFVYDSQQMPTVASLPVWPRASRPYAHVPAGRGIEVVEVQRQPDWVPAENVSWPVFRTPEGLVFFWAADVNYTTWHGLDFEAMYESTQDWRPLLTIVDREYLQWTPILTAVSLAGVAGVPVFTSFWRRSRRQPAAPSPPGTAELLASVDTYLRRLQTYMLLAGGLLAAFGILASAGLARELAHEPHGTLVWHFLPVALFGFAVVALLGIWWLDMQRLRRERRRVLAILAKTEPF